MFHLTRFARIIAVGVTTLALALFAISFVVDIKSGVEIELHFPQQSMAMSEDEILKKIHAAILKAGHPLAGEFALGAAGSGKSAAESYFSAKYVINWRNPEALLMAKIIKQDLYRELHAQFEDFIPVEHPARGAFLREIATYLLIFLFTFLWLFGVRRQH